MDIKKAQHHRDTICSYTARIERWLDELENLHKALGFQDKKKVATTKSSVQNPKQPKKKEKQVKLEMSERMEKLELKCLYPIEEIITPQQEK